jgi:uncharacterized protein (TIGR02328 family)
MRLWHKDIIKFLPKSQLIAQWRELNSIYVKQDNHILINYIYKYPKSYLYAYSQIVINEMKKRGYKINKWDNYNNYFEDCVKDIWINEYINELTFDEHKEEYFMICYWNLTEKFIRGQKDFSQDEWNKLDRYKIQNYG